MKMFSMCLNQVDLAIFTLLISKTKLLIHLVVYNNNKQGQFIFSSHNFVLILRTLTSIYAYTVFKNECSQFKNCVSYNRTRNIKLHAYIYTYLTFSSYHFVLILRTRMNVLNSRSVYIKIEL